jgi:hypothetical protein
MGVTCSGYVCSAVQGGGKRRWFTGTIGVSVRPAQCYDQRVGVFAHIPAMANPVFRVELRMARSSSSDRLDLITQFRAAVFELANLLRQLPKASRLLGPPALARHGEGHLAAALGKAAAKRGGNTGN